ncbi:uncharacterized protein [Amphiura filiformis]|uniref:uncharacterized protein n=1 Tax=Amphiura filiformis TaxID=82378 RepID=UPI003B219FC9
MEDIIQGMIKELPQDSDDEEPHEALPTDSREEVQEDSRTQGHVSNETISLPANNPNVFRKNRAREEETKAAHADDTKVPPRNARHLEGRHSDSDESDQNTWYISPPANRGGKKTNGDRQTVIDSQPNVWVPYTLDPISKAELEDLKSAHKTHDALKDILKTELGEMSKENPEGEKHIVLNDSISYTEFFRDFHYFTGLLYDDEEILMNNQFIPFRHAVFNLLDNWLPAPNSSANQNTASCQVMMMGRAILTNHRLILISAEQQKGAELRKLDFTSDNGKADSYQIRTNHHDTLHYRCIPLNKFHSIEMQAAVGVVKTTNVTGNRMSCCSWRCLPGCDFFSKRWQAQETLSSRTNTRLVTCGVILPPWDSRAALQIYMDPSVPLYHVKNFMLELQKNAPGLHPSSIPSFAGY